MDKRYFDVNVFVHYLTNHPEFADRARILDKKNEGHIHFRNKPSFNLL